jgi:uncharacterized protein (TIGR03083 family)
MTHPDQQPRPARPAPSVLLGWIGVDARLLLEAARSAPKAQVPTCPGWTARDVVDHVGSVYAHKVACIRLRRRPEPSDLPDVPDDDQPLFAWFDEQLTELLHELTSHRPSDPAWTWFDDDQTVGFWARRMAHETAIHRVDAELAAGAPLSPHDGALALDGVDEVLGVFLASDDVLQDESCDVGAGGSVLVEAGGRGWLVELPDGGHRMRAVSEPVESDVRVGGAASDAYRALWNRPTEDGVVRHGDPDVLARLDGRLLLATE